MFIVQCSIVVSHLSGPSRIPYRRNVAASMSLQQSLVSYRKEWEPVEIILIVHFHSLGETGAGVSRRDQADQHTIHIHLIAVRCSSTTESSAVGEFGIGCRIEGENITREAVLNGNRAAQVDDVDDVYAWPFELGHSAVRQAQRLVDAERLDIADQHGEKDVGAEVRHIFHGAGVKVECLALGTNETSVKKRQGIAANLHPLAPSFDTGDDVVWIHGLGLLPADARPDPDETVGRVRLQHTIVRYAVRKDVTDWDLESDGEDIEAGEHVSRRCFGTPRARDSAEVACIQINEIEDSFFVQLIRIVELAGDDPSAIRQVLDELINERLVEKTDGTAGRISGVITLEGAKTVDEPRPHRKQRGYRSHRRCVRCDARQYRPPGFDRRPQQPYCSTRSPATVVCAGVR